EIAISNTVRALIKEDSETNIVDPPQLNGTEKPSRGRSRFGSFIEQVTSPFRNTTTNTSEAINNRATEIITEHFQN
ncbi:MAG: hypothetical protein KDC92_17160, partial [Bacteroidetes bacterium]|nr:hypothetical protein [Bacteroidota bacterium]